MRHIGDDLRYAARQLKRSPALTVLVIATLAVSIGATTTLFSLLNAFVLRTLPVRDPERLVAVSVLDQRARPGMIPLAATIEIGRRAQVFEAVSAYNSGGLLETEVPGRGPVQRSVEVVTPGYYEVLGIRPALGRLLSDEDVANAGAPAPVVVISYAFWQREFGGSTDVLGRTLLVEGQPLEIVGVTPSRFTGLRVEVAPQLGLSVQVLRRLMPVANPKAPLRSPYVIGRLKPGVTLSQAQAELHTIWTSLPGSLASAEPSSVDLQNQRLVVESVARGFSVLRSRYSQPLYLLVALTAVLLLIACSNLSGMLVARLAARQRELSVCLSLGATRARLARQLLFQNLLLAGAGTAVAVPIAWWTTRALAARVWTGLVPMTLDVTPDARVLGSMAAVSVGAALVISLVPAFIVSRRIAIFGSVQQTLLDGRSPNILGKMLLVAQVAMSLVLLLGAGLLGRTLHNLRAIDLGFRSEGVVFTRLTPRVGGYQGLNAASYYPDLVSRLSAPPEIASVALSRIFPTPILDQRPIALAESTDKAAEVTGMMETVSPRFFETLGIRLLQGRDVSWQDTTGSAGVVIINRCLEERLFPAGSALGRRVRIGNDVHRRSLEIVGVVDDARTGDYRSQPGPVAYRPWLQELPGQTPIVLVRSTGVPALAVDHMGRVVQSLGREQFLAALTLTNHIGQSFLQERLMAELAISLAVLAILLAFLGVYGLQSYAVARRTPEIGLRMALGASRTIVMRMILRDSVLVTAVGVAIGAPFSLWSAYGARSLFFNLSPFDAASVGAAVAALLIVGAAAGLRPAYRASLSDPIAALRRE